jgi:hypothetical protein
MNPYLAKLRERDQETRHPQEPSKPSKPIMPVVTHADATIEKRFEGFEGDDNRCFSRNEEVVQTPGGRFCRCFEHLESRCPDLIPNERWQEAIQDSRSFLVQWCEQAEALGWTAKDLFGLHRPPTQPHPSYSRLARYDETGLIWLLCGRQVLELTESTAAVENPTGALTVYQRHNKPPLGPFGDSLEDLAGPSTLITADKRISR